MSAAAEAFTASQEMFTAIAGFLGGAEAGELTCDQLEEDLAGKGRDLLRQLLQDHLDLRAAREQKLASVTGSDGVGRTRPEEGRHRPAGTVFGKVAVTRLAYRAPRTPNLHPADAALNLPAGLYSHSLARHAAAEAARCSFESAQDGVLRATGQQIGKRQLQELVAGAARDIDGFYACRTIALSGAAMLLVLQFDGKGVTMIPAGLRPATARAAAKAQHKLATRLSKGEKSARRRMAEVAVVYDTKPVPRGPGDIITTPGTGRERKRAERPRATGKWLTASVTDDIPAVIAAGFGEAERRDPGHQRTWVALVDGNRQQIDTIQAEAARKGVTVHLLIDLVHVQEYVWDASWCFFTEGDPAAEKWVGSQLLKILGGKATQVAAGIRRRASTTGLAAGKRKDAGTCARYLTAKAPFLDYPTALAGGWPIATGAVEGACRRLPVN